MQSLLKDSLQNFSEVSKPFQRAHLEASAAVTCEIQPLTDIQKAHGRHTEYCSVHSARSCSSSRYLTLSTPQGMLIFSIARQRALGMRD